ncbi:hypothetical protein DEU56DRAFT_759716 [Suillus clintonianus]|uniref:uncharacterized protein n=1 Tax=Suillus clintonianus TaxID=1904413 RepID=UPI001B86AAC9|nr:uncharacterized protein DEU56DRAFT_759716 [Suillus clintonianus]KAG2124359.1 hypothetical protein DEU56DRAFT_759716 [Suillus clintonianus]
MVENEILELKNYLPEWTSAKRNEKPAVFTAIARAARLFAPKVNQAQWKKRKQERKDMIKYRRWEEVLKRIEDKSGAKPGGPGRGAVVMLAWKNEMNRERCCSGCTMTMRI